MYFEECVVRDNIYIGDKYADPCKIIVVGNGGFYRYPHFDLVGGDLYCLIPLQEPGFILNCEARPSAKYTLEYSEREIINNILDEKNSFYKNLTNWQVACKYWNNACPENIPQIDEDFYINLKNKPNYAKKHIYFIDCGFYTRIFDDGTYKLKK